jgi:hypothetical protein
MARLHFGHSVFELPDDVDLTELRTRIFDAVHNRSGMGDWLDVPVVSGGERTVVSLYLSPFAPLWIEL